MTPFQQTPAILAYGLCNWLELWGDHCFAATTQNPSFWDAKVCTHAFLNTCQRRVTLQRKLVQNEDQRAAIELYISQRPQHLLTGSPISFAFYWKLEMFLSRKHTSHRVTMPRKVQILFLLCYLSFDDRMSQQCPFSDRKEKKSGRKGTALCSDRRECNSEGWHQKHGLAWQQNCRFPEIVKEYWVPGVKDSQGDCGAGRRMCNNFERSSATSSATWEGKFGVCV